MRPNEGLAIEWAIHAIAMGLIAIDLTRAAALELKDLTMAFTKDSLLTGPVQVTRAQAKAYAKAAGAEGNWEDYIDFVYDHADDVGLAPDAVFGQWLVETNKGKSPRWLK